MLQFHPHLQAATGSLSVTVTSPVATVTGLTVTGPKRLHKEHYVHHAPQRVFRPDHTSITAQSFTTTDPIVATAYQRDGHGVARNGIGGWNRNVNGQLRDATWQWCAVGGGRNHVRIERPEYRD